MIYQTFRYRLYPTKAQVRVLADTLDTCRDLYNSLLHWRTYDYDCLGRSPTRFEQQAALPGWRKTHPELKRIHSQALQDVVHRVDRAFQDFFHRVKDGEKPGHPKRRDKGYDSFTYTQSGFHLKDNKLSGHCSVWLLLRLVLTRKAVGVGRQAAEVNPANTSRRCSGCGRVAPKTLAERHHRCAVCGLALDRDTNAAVNILQDARRASSLSRSITPCTVSL